MRAPSFWGGALLVAALIAPLSCGSEDDGNGTPEPFLAVLGTFPAELSALLDRATVDEEVASDGRVFRIGAMGGVRVVLGMTGIGLVNASETTRAVLDTFPVTGVVVSGVAGSPHRIGDLTVPEAWTLADGTVYTAHAEWLDLACEVAIGGEASLTRCTRRPDVPSADLVCLAFEPAIFVGGIGRSNDPFGGEALPCQPEGEAFPDVFGCDVAPAEGAAAFYAAPTMAAALTAPDPPEPVAGDMETAAIAAEATARGLPFIAFRAVSDGAEDPLDLPGFPTQFFAYYRLAAENAASATLAFLERLASTQ